jgi:hypothetical protein
VARGRKAKNPKTPFEQLKELAPEWLESALSTKDEDLRQNTIKLELENKLIEDQKKLDQDIPRLAEELKYAREPYDLPIKTNKLKQRVCALLLEQRGKA